MTLTHRFSGPECDGSDCTDVEHREGCALFTEQPLSPTGLSLADGQNDEMTRDIVQIEREAIIIFVAVERAKVEILADIRAGIVPTTVTSFSDLHDYVDANEYGGMTDIPVNLNLANPIQDALDAWIKEQGHVR